MDISVSTPVNTRALVVGAAIVDDLLRPTILLSARRTEPPELAGGWELPGGKVEPGEHPRGRWRESGPSARDISCR